MSTFRLDRILHEDEILQIRNLLIPILKDEYPNFEVWLDKALSEIKEGIRLAIGIWKEKLIAASIIKITASNTAELKSFFIDPNFRDYGYGNTLYEETEKQCMKAGVTRIITDVYCDNKSMVEFLISKDFIIGGKVDLYGNNRPSYIMSKPVKPEYLGDLYDWEELGEWFVIVNFGAVKIKNHPIVSNRRFDRHMQILLGNQNLDILTEIKDQKVDLDPVEILHKKCMESTFHLPLFIAREFTERARDYANKHGVLIFDGNDIAGCLGFKPPRFSEGPVSGMIVAIKSEYFESLFLSEPPVIYVKGGPAGKYLERGHIIAFYLTHPDKKIVALGEVSSIQLGSPMEIWDSIGDKLVFSKEEFFRFSSIKKNILAIELKRVWKITPIEGEELNKLIPRKDRSGSYLDQEIVDELIRNTPQTQE